MKYTLITPHFDDAERLDRLLRSVPIGRTDLEVIVVDDCSPDQEALESLRACWPKVRWLSTSTNAGAGVARNVGLDAALGRWIVFADSDDEFLVDAFSILDRIINPCDELIYFLAEAVQEFDGSMSVRSGGMNDLVLDYIQSPSSDTLKRLKAQHVVPWPKVYSRVFIEMHRLRFDPVRRSNDVAFNVLAAVQAKNVRAEKIPIYRIYRRAGSLTANFTKESLLERLKVVGKLNDRLRALGASERMHAASYIVRAVFFGPSAFFEIFQLVIRHKMLGSTLWRLRPREIWRFLRRYQRSSLEWQRLKKAGGGANRAGNPKPDRE